MGENFAEVWQSDRCPPALKKMIFRTVIEEIIVRTNPEQEDSALHHSLERRRSHSDGDGSSAFSDRNGNVHGGIRNHPADGRSPW